MLSLPGTRMKRILAFTFFLLFLAAFAFTSLDGIKRKADQQQGSSAEQPALDLAGTNWRLADTGGTEIENSGGVFVRFEPDGSLDGFAGCNNFFGAYALDGSNLSISSLGATRKMCPELFMDIETTFMNALQNVRSFSISSGSLQLIDDQGRTLTLAGSTI